VRDRLGDRARAHRDVAHRETRHSAARRESDANYIKIKTMTVDDAIAASRATDASRVDEITDLFVAAGCHRARFASLAPFDRVLGALAWAVRAADGALDDVDADALYATMGERLRACEAIERALRDMGAPGALRAHQIGGLDADALLPTARWLITRVLETRERRKRDARARAMYAYKRTCGREALGTARTRERAARARRALREEYGARRRYKRAAGKEPPRENASRWAKSVMMEYGHKLAGLEAFASAATAVLAATRWRRRTRAGKAAGATRASETGEGGREGAASLVSKVSALVVAPGAGGDEDDEEEDEAAVSELNALRDLESELAVADGEDTLSSAVARAILGARGGEEILAAAEKFGGEIAIGGTVGKMLAVERKIAAMERKLAAETAAASEARQRAEAAQAEVVAALEELEKVTAYNDKCETETKSLMESVADPGQRASVERVMALIKRASSTKADEKEFKAECKKRMLELKDEIERGGEHTLTEEERAQIEEVDATHRREREKFEGERAMLNKRSRAVALLRRKLEDIPTRPELIQYERRFEELYDTVQAKLKETRKYFAAYNVLADTKKYLRKEISLLNSVQQQVAPALETLSGKSSLVTALAAIQDGVTANIKLVDAKLKSERDAEAECRARHDDAVRLQRQYVALVKELRDAVARERELSAALAPSS
jgi:hypothetical protein